MNKKIINENQYFPSSNKYFLHYIFKNLVEILPKELWINEFNVVDKVREVNLKILENLVEKYIESDYYRKKELIEIYKTKNNKLIVNNLFLGTISYLRENYEKFNDINIYQNPKSVCFKRNIKNINL